jgi:fluoroquinolone resistance protein
VCSSDLFVDCRFDGCNLSMARLCNTTFRDIKFNSCKMLGMHFQKCNGFGLSASFEKCNLNHSSFYGTKFKKTIFKNSSLQEVDFTACDLSGSVFDSCDFAKARFDAAVLEKADFRSSFNYSIDPERNKMKNAKFSLPGVVGLLEKYDIDIQ